MSPFELLELLITVTFNTLSLILKLRKENNGTGNSETKGAQKAHVGHAKEGNSKRLEREEI